MRLMVQQKEKDRSQCRLNSESWCRVFFVNQSMTANNSASEKEEEEM